MTQREKVAPNPLFEQYAVYTADTEPMWWYHRWCLYSAVAALLGRRFYFEHGHFTVNPNLYLMLVGDTGSRKSSAIKLIGKRMRELNLVRFAGDKGSKERFLADMEGEEIGDDLDAAAPAWMTGGKEEPREIYVVADEFNDFIGINNTEFASLLGNLWDYEGVFEYRIKTGKSARVPEPTVNILGGNTSQNIALAFPTELLGQGFFGRLILVYGEKSGRKITFPKKPSASSTAELLTTFQKIHVGCRGPATLHSKAADILDRLYQTWPDMQDARFKSYANRRFTQLLKLCTINAAGRQDTCITRDDVILANTVLSAAEELMPHALGEFGKSRNSGVATAILEILNAADAPVKVLDLWKHVRKDLTKITELGELMQGLEHAEKVILVKGQGYLPRRNKRRNLEFVDWEILTEEERKLLSKA